MTTHADTGTRTGRPRSFDRAAALRVAMLLFWEHGYDCVGIADLTKAMGIRTASLYAAFGSKKQLYREARELYLAEEQPLWTIATGGPLREAVEAALDLAVRVSLRPGRPRGCMVALGFVEATPSHADVAAENRSHRERTRAKLTQLFEAGLASGQLAAESDARELAAFLSTVMLGISLQARDGMAEPDLRAVAHAALARIPFATDHRAASDRAEYHGLADR